MSKELTKAYLQKEYAQNKRSTSSIAKEMGLFPEQINRALEKFGIPKRTRGEALANAYETGSKEHPTKGKESSESTKLAISESNYRVWHEKSEEQKQVHVEKAKKVWNKRTKKEKEDFIKMGIDGIRKASKLGSKMEHMLFRLLKNEGHNVVFHYNKILANEKLEIDIFVQNLGVAIEVDGPSHFYPVWGEEALAKTRKADIQKMGLLLGKGLSIIRLRHFGDTKSNKYCREVSKILLETLEKFKTKPKEPTYLEITPTPYSGQHPDISILNPSPIRELIIENKPLRIRKDTTTGKPNNAKKKIRTKRPGYIRGPEDIVGR
jgi:very-short-patch-repair endonuclease